MNAARDANSLAESCAFAVRSGLLRAHRGQDGCELVADLVATRRVLKKIAIIEFTVAAGCLITAVGLGNRLAYAGAALLAFGGAATLLGGQVDTGSAAKRAKYWNLELLPETVRTAVGAGYALHLQPVKLTIGRGLERRFTKRCLVLFAKSPQGESQILLAVEASRAATRQIASFLDCLGVNFDRPGATLGVSVSAKEHAQGNIQSARLV